MSSVFKDDILADKVAFVTGGGSGICKGITQAFMAHGASAAILGRKAERLEASAKELSEATGKSCIATPGDVRDPAQVEAALDATIEKFGKIDIIVNGAAGNFVAPAAVLSYKGFRTIVDIAAFGSFNVCRAAFDRKLADGGGAIINISAIQHYTATLGQTHTSAAKAAVDSLTRQLALEWGPAGIRVNGIAPGPIKGTEGMDKLMPKGKEKELEKIVPIQRYGTVPDIANAAVFLASDAASFIHGQTLIVDGGTWLPGMGAAFRAMMGL